MGSNELDEEAVRGHFRTMRALLLSIRRRLPDLRPVWDAELAADALLRLGEVLDVVETEIGLAGGAPESPALPDGGSAGKAHP